jgi:hypothetical protein
MHGPMPPTQPVTVSALPRQPGNDSRDPGNMEDHGQAMHVATQSDSLGGPSGFPLPGPDLSPTQASLGSAPVPNSKYGSPSCRSRSRSGRRVPGYGLQTASLDGRSYTCTTTPCKGSAPEHGRWLPRRSARVAAQGRRRVSNPEIQVQNVLTRKLNVLPADKSPDAEAMESYNRIFRSPLSSSHRKAIRALFTSNCPSSEVAALEVEP